MRKLVVERKSGIVGYCIPVIIVCDDKTIGSVRSGNSVTLQIDEHSHDIYCHTGNNFQRRTSDVINIKEGNSDIHLVTYLGCFTFKLSKE